jgi:phosphoglycerol transferase MdoB-like AlkP superfamily enzyme
MSSPFRLGIRALLWSLLIVGFTDYARPGLNPFQGLVLLVLLVLALIIQLILLRKRGIAYIGLFLGSVVLLTIVFLYLDNQFISHPTRYYSTR